MSRFPGGDRGRLGIVVGNRSCPEVIACGFVGEGLLEFVDDLLDVGEIRAEGLALDIGARWGTASRSCFVYGCCGW